MTADRKAPTEYRPGVGIVLVNPQGLIFTGRRKDNRAPPWQMPQGGLQDGEDPRQAVLREIGEETGIEQVRIIAVHPEWLHYDYPARSDSKRADRYRGQKHRWFLLHYEGPDAAIRLDKPHGEFSDWRWGTPDEIIREAIAFKQPIYRQVFSYFAPSLHASPGLKTGHEHPSYAAL